MQREDCAASEEVSPPSEEVCKHGPSQPGKAAMEMLLTSAPPAPSSQVTSNLKILTPFLPECIHSTPPINAPMPELFPKAPPLTESSILQTLHLRHLLAGSHCDRSNQRLTQVFVLPWHPLITGIRALPPAPCWTSNGHLLSPLLPPTKPSTL